MRSENTAQIAQKERATERGPLLDVWPAPAGSLVKCPVCDQKFIKKRLKHFFHSSDKCRFAFWNRQRMDFGTLSRKLDIIIERLPEKGMGIKEEKNVVL